MIVSVFFDKQDEMNTHTHIHKHKLKQMTRFFAVAPTHLI